MPLKQFTIDEQYITDVTVRQEGSVFGDRTDLTADELVKVLTGQDRWVSTSSKDHDEFAKLRNQLEELGYIKTERGWWNGDRVLKAFKLNEWTFRKGDKFASAAAMQNSIDCARKFGWKSISKF